MQGVFFRDSTEERAQRAGVDGWVRNRSDGTVEAVFEGASAAVEDLLRFCAVGPSWARVEQVEVSEESPTEERGFRVTR